MIDKEKLTEEIQYYYVNGFHGKSPKTRETYIQEIVLFEAWLSHKGFTLKDFNFVTVQQYVDFFEYQKKKPATIKKKLNAIKHYCRFTGQNEKCEGVSVIKSNTSMIAPKALTRNERNAMLREASKRSPRDYAIVCFLLYTGVRVEECSNLLIGSLFDIGDKKGFARIIGKGNKERVVPLNNDVRIALNLYLKERNIDFYNQNNLDERQYEPLFASTHGKNISTRRIQQIVKETGDTHPHTLRHTFATIQLREKGTDPVIVAQILGHSNLNLLQRYTQATMEDLVNTVENM